MKDFTRWEQEIADRLFEELWEEKEGQEND